MRIIRDARGFTLTEIAVASLIFLFIAIAAFSMFTQSNKLYKSGDKRAEMQQRTRLAFEIMLDELRLAGNDYNRDGDQNEYADATDEQVEFVSSGAITFRANLDAADGNSGREANLEIKSTDPGWGTECCPIVTTGNDEIVTYALRSDKTEANRDDIALSVDTSAPRDSSWDNFGSITGEEAVTIRNVDLDGGDPPYTLMRFTLGSDGSVQEMPIAANIRSMTFSYEGTDGNDYYCLSPEADGTCQQGNQRKFDSLGGRDDISNGDGQRRAGRAAIRTISLQLVGMTDQDELGWTDKSDTLMPGRRKLTLTAAVVPQNLGMKGRPDLDDGETRPPENVTICAGQCNTVRVEWDEAQGALGYLVKLWTPGAVEPFLVGATPGISVSNSTPPRVYAYYQHSDATQIVEGARLFATVASRVGSDRSTEDSFPSPVATLADVVRVEEPKNVNATGYDPSVTGWPDVVSYQIPPLTTAGLAASARGNSIVVSWEPPVWGLQVTNQSNPTGTVTTRTGSGTLPPLDCDKELPAPMSNPASSDYRTRARDVFGSTRYLIFRSTNPRFVPTNADYVGATQGSVDIVNGRIAYVDESLHNYKNGVFNSTGNAMANCTTYYYRVRAVDACWDGTNPAGTNAHISPFSPRLNSAANAINSDDVTGLAPENVSLAIPGYSIPKSVPKAPTKVRFRMYDRDVNDGDGRDAVISFDAVKMDGSQAGSGTLADPFVPAYDDIAIAQYRVYQGNSANFTLSDCKNLTNGVQQVALLDVRDLKAGRIAYDDENGDGTIQSSEDEIVTPSPWPAGLAPRTGLRIDLGGGSQKFYKVVALQCANERTVPSTSDHEAYDWGEISEARKFPCDFGGGAYSLVTVDASSFPSSVTCDATVELDTVAATRARLILKDRASGDRTITADPGLAPSSIGGGRYRATFGASDIAALTDNFGTGSYLIACEMDDVNGCIGQSDSQDQVLSTPACCLRAPTPSIQSLTNTHWSNTVTENCGLQYLRIYQITLTVDNASGSTAERFTDVQWNGSSIWTGTSTSVVIDRSANPLTLAAGQSGTLTGDMSKNSKGNNATIRYDYKIGGVTGSCTFAALLQ